MLTLPVWIEPAPLGLLAVRFFSVMSNTAPLIAKSLDGRYLKPTSYCSPRIGLHSPPAPSVQPADPKIVPNIGLKDCA